MEEITQEKIEWRLSLTPPDKHSDEKTAAERLEICNACEKKTKKLNMDACSDCGCLLILKAKFKFSRCPLNKWETPKE